MSNIIVKKVNESMMFIDCSASILAELQRYFSAKVPNCQFMPSFKNGNWDGIARFIDYRTNQMQIGLFHELKQFAKQGRYTLEADFKMKEEIDFEEFNQFVSSLNLSKTPRDYQIQAAYDAIRFKHLNIHSITGSGKSMVCYIIIRWLESKNIKTLMIVPQIQLTIQLIDNFIEYGWTDAERKCCVVYGGQKRLIDRNIQISTWQSASIKKEDYLEYEALIIDESFLAKAISISNLAKYMINAKYRIGCSGTYPEPKTADWFTIVGGCGPIVKYSSYKDLQDINQISKLKIKGIILNYPEKIRWNNYNQNHQDYQKEVDYITNIKERQEFIIKLAQKLSGNTLILFTKKEQGKALYNLYKKTHPARKVFYIDGDIALEDRKYICEYSEKNPDCVIFGSFGTMAVGISLNEVVNLIFASSYKSKNKILQGLGRSLRISKTAEYATLYDIVDNLAIRDKEKKIYYINSSIKHYKERIKIYNDEKFDVKTIEYSMKISN